MRSLHDAPPAPEIKNDDKSSIPELDLSPIKITQKLRSDLLILITDYRNTHQTIESELVRKHLYHIENRISHPTSSKKACQEKYLELCGLLYTLQSLYVERANISAEEITLKEMIHKILVDHQLKPVYQLSNRIRLNGNCRELYRTLNPIEESTDYINALYQLQQTIKQPNIPDNIYLAVNSLIKEIEIMKNASRKHMAYYINILTTTNRFIHPASNPRPTFNEYLTLANDAPGRSSAWRKITGNILYITCAAGLALCIASCLFLTGGFAAPFIFLGITSAIAQLGVIGLIGGSFVGYKLKASGEVHGVSKAMLDCHNATKKHSQKYSEFFRTPPLRSNPREERASASGAKRENPAPSATREGPVYSATRDDEFGSPLADNPSRGVSPASSRL